MLETREQGLPVIVLNIMGSGMLRFEQQVGNSFNKNPLSVHSGLVTIKADSMGICYPL